MRQFYLAAFSFFLFSGASAQRFSMDDLVSFTGFPTEKFDNYISKRGYRQQDVPLGSDSLAYAYYDKKAKAQAFEKFILRCNNEDRAVISFQTTLQEEFANLSAQLKEEGYHFAGGQGSQALYQKGNITIQPVVKKEGGKTVYSFVIERKALPRARDIHYAEDFLQLSSHEYLVSVFGAANVKKDNFYFTDTEINKCSVLYPNTNMQVIFIWKDEVNSRDIAFLLVGGQLRAQGSINYHKQIEQNTWQSNQGIYMGMSLKELQKLNGNNMDIYGWQSSQPGVVAEKNAGAIQFKNIGIILNCLDCNEDRFYSNNELIASSSLLAEGRRVYVTTLVILPGAK